MKLLKLVCLTALLSLLPFPAFANKPATCPPLATILDNADSLDTVSVVLSKIPPPRLSNDPYIVFSLVPVKVENKFWFLMTIAQTNTMDEALVAGAEHIKLATGMYNDLPDEEGPVQLCGYVTPQDEDFPTVVAISFPVLLPGNMVSYVKNHVMVKEVKHKFGFSIK